MYPLNKSEMVYWNVEVKIPCYNRNVGIELLLIITLLINYCLNKQNASRNFRHVLLHSSTH